MKHGYEALERIKLIKIQNYFFLSFNLRHCIIFFYVCQNGGVKTADRFLS